MQEKNKPNKSASAKSNDSTEDWDNIEAGWEEIEDSAAQEFEGLDDKTPIAGEDQRATLDSLREISSSPEMDESEKDQWPEGDTKRVTHEEQLIEANENFRPTIQAVPALNLDKDGKAKEDKQAQADEPSIADQTKQTKRLPIIDQTDDAEENLRPTMQAPALTASQMAQAANIPIDQVQSLKKTEMPDKRPAPVNTLEEVEAQEQRASLDSMDSAKAFHESPAESITVIKDAGMSGLTLAFLWIVALGSVAILIFVSLYRC